MAVFLGDAVVVETSAGSTRYFALRTEDTAGGTGSDRTTWQGDAGSSITLYFKTGTTGALPPGTASVVELLVYYETGTGTLVRTLHNGAPPADGTPYTFHFTNTGESGGSPRCGQLRLYVRADRNTAITYDVNSDANGDQGVIRSNMVVSDLSVNAYPSGSKFAYGTASNESFTLTATHTQKYADRDNETYDLESTDATDVAVETFSDVEVGAATTTAQAYVVDDTYATGDNNYGARFRVNNSGLLRTNQPWTVPVDGGANVTQDGTNAVKRSAFYVVNPDVTIGTVTLGESVYNREETATLSFPITNARGESLTRSMTTRIKDSGGTVKKTITDTGGTYGDGGAGDYAIAATDKATNDLTGDQWTLEGNTTGARFTNTPNVYAVSRMWQGGKENTGVDGGVKTGKTAGADDATIRNRGQTLFFDGFIYNARGELLAGPTVNFNVRPTGSETYDESNDTVALASGQFQDSYSVETDETVGDKTLVVASQTTASANQPRAGTGGSGNFFETTVQRTLDDVGTNHGLLVGLNVPVLVASPFSGEGNAFDFDGVPDLGGNAAGIRIRSDPSIGVATSDNTFKITAKIRRGRQGAGVTEAICGKWDTGISNENWLLQISGDKLALSCVNGSATIVSAVGTTTLLQNTLYDIEGEWDGATLRVKVGGVQEGSTPAFTAFQAPNATTPLTIGRISGGASFPFDGIIDKVELTKDGTVVSRWEMDALSEEAEWSVSATYTVESRTQKTSERTGDAESTQFTIGEDVVYNFAHVADASGDDVDGARVDFFQINPSNAQTQQQLDIATGSDGWAPDPGQVFDSRAPAGVGWIQRATINSDAANNGNSGTNDQSIAMLSAFTANKAVITGFGAIAGVPNTAGYDTHVLGEIPRPGDRLLVGVAIIVEGTRTAPDATPVPTFSLAQFNQSTAKVEVLQSDGTWKDQDDVGYEMHFFDFKQGVEPDDGTGGSGDALEWIATIGTAGQGVTTGNGYVFDTATWLPGSIFVVAQLHLDAQSFYAGRAHLFSVPLTFGDPFNHNGFILNGTI